MKKKTKNSLLSVLLAATATTAVGGAALIFSTNVSSATAETQTTRFQMVNGASIRYSSPLGMRFIAELGEKEYAELTAADGVTRKMGMYIMPYSYIDKNEDGTLDVTDYASVETKLDYVFYANDGSETDQSLYEYEDEDGDTYYRANGVISNLKLQNYAKEFVGIGYIAETKNGETTYEYTNISYNKNVRTAAYVAIEAHADPDYADVDNAMSAFTQYIDGAQLHSKYNVTQNDDGKFVYNGAEYDTLAQIKNTIENYAYGLTLDKSVKYVKADGTAKLSATLSDTLNDVTFKGAHAVYSSSDESVVTVDKTGTLTYVKNGTATITATFMGKTQTCEVISGAIIFDDMTSNPSYIAGSRIDSFSIVSDTTKDGKTLKAQTTSDSTGDTALYLKTETMGVFFEDDSIEYMAFDVMTDSASAAGTDGAYNVYYHDWASGSGAWTKYEPNGNSQYSYIPNDAFKTYYYPRAAYEALVNNNKTNERFLMAGARTGIFGGKSFYIDNIRGVTAEEYANGGYGFERGNIRTNSTTPLYYSGTYNQWDFSFSNISSWAFTNEIVSEGGRALSLTKTSSGDSAFGFNGNSGAETVMELAMRGQYIAFDFYVPKGSDAKVKNSSGWTHALKTEDWNTVYVIAPTTGTEWFRFNDTTGGTYVVDNIRFVTEEEYLSAVYSFENAGTIRADGTNYMYYGGADQGAVLYSIAVTGNRTGLYSSDEQVKDGDYSLKITKDSTGAQANLQMRADSAFWATMKNGFTFWIYSDKAITSSNFCNAYDKSFLESAINANEWTQITVTADDLKEISGDSGYAMLRIKGDWTTIYIDNFKPLDSYTVTYEAGEGSVESTTQTVYSGVSYTLETPTYNTYLYEFLGWYYGDELVPTTGTWTIESDVTLTAKYAETGVSGNFYNATYTDISATGTVTGLTLQASSYSGTSTGALPQPTGYTEDMSYYRFNGEYGLNDFLVFDFTGDNMPLLTFFNNSVTNTIYNHAQNADVKGWLVTNGITLINGAPYGTWTGAHANRITLCGPYQISYTYDDNGTDQQITQVRTSNGSATSPNPASMAQLKDSTDEYRAVIGWVENGTNMNLRMLVWNLTTGAIVTDVSFGGVAQADWEGDIVLYGHFGRSTVVNKVYPIVEGFDNAKALYKPAMQTYNATWNGDGLTLGQSTYSGAVTRPDVGSTDMSYIAFNGSYGVDDYLVFDFTGENMPIVSFFNNEVTNTVYNNASVTSNSAGVKDANAHGIVICGGMYDSAGASALGAVGTGVNACRLIVVGNQKVLGWDDDSNSSAGGYRVVDGNSSSVNPLSITGLQGVTDTYRVIMGFSAAGTLEVRVINMVTGELIYNLTKTGLTSKLETGSIALHGQFGKTTVLDRVFGVVEGKIADVLTTYGKDTDYSDAEATYVLSRYAYSSISDGTYTIDGTSYCASCDTLISDSHTVCKDFRTDPNSYTVYASAGLNVMLPQAAIEDSDATEVKTCMENAASAGLKVILSDWQLQILSTPLTLSSGEVVASNSSYAPWILASDASATTGLAAEYLAQLNELGITPDTSRFADRAALDTYVKGQLEAYSSYEAFLGVMLGDEPSYHNAYCYGEVYKSIKRVMPECYVQYNLLPLEQSLNTIKLRYPGLNDSSTTADIENAYKQYVELFIDAMGTDYIQYDDYPFKSSTITYTEGYLWWKETIEETTPYVDNTSLRNIQLIAEIAKERGLSVKVVTQTCLSKSGSTGYVHIRQITEDDARWLNNYLMGFGVKQINYFTYWTKAAKSATGETFADGGSFVNDDGTTTAVYEFMKTIMAENDAFWKTISHFDYNESKVVGSDTDSSLNNDHITWNDSAVVNADATFRWVSDVTTDKEFTLVTELYDEENYNYMYMVMNTIDPNSGGTQSITVTFDSSITSFYVYQPDGKRELVSGNTYTVSLTAGQAVYLLPKL